MIFYGEGLIYLRFLNKLLTLTSVGAGAFIGWIVSNIKVLSEGRKFGFTKSYFGLVYMWFLVHLTRQGLVRGNIKAGSSALYSVDRG